MLEIILNVIAVILAIYVAYSYGMDNDNWFGRWVNSWLNTSQSKKYSLRQIDEAWSKLANTRAKLKEFKKKLDELEPNAEGFSEKLKKYSDQIAVFSELERHYVDILEDACLYQIRCKMDAEEEIPKLEEEMQKIQKEILGCEEKIRNSASENLEFKHRLNRLNSRLAELRTQRCRDQAIMNEPDDDDFLE